MVFGRGTFFFLELLFIEAWNCCYRKCSGLSLVFTLSEGFALNSTSDLSLLTPSGAFHTRSRVWKHHSSVSPEMSSKVP